MKGLKEVTGGEFPPHIYFMTKCGEAIYGYHNCKADKFVMFKRSMKFYKARRKFEKVTYS